LFYYFVSEFTKSLPPCGLRVNLMDALPPPLEVAVLSLVFYVLPLEGPRAVGWKLKCTRISACVFLTVLKCALAHSWPPEDKKNTAERWRVWVYRLYSHL